MAHVGGMFAGLLFCRCRDGCGFGASLESGADSFFPRRLRSSAASLAPRSSELGACPRPMDLRRCLHLVHGECLLRFLSKPHGDGAPSDLGMVAMASGQLMTQLPWSKLLASFHFFYRVLLQNIPLNHNFAYQYILLQLFLHR